MKWLWRYNEQGQALWKEVIKSKYGELNPWCSNVSSNPYGAGVWRTIRNLWPSLESNLNIKVGDGTKAKFWGDSCNNQRPLKDSFPDLYRICNNPEGAVNECWSDQGWNLSFRRLLNDWEVDRVANLLHSLQEFKGTTSEPDTLRWMHRKDGVFSVNKAYRLTNMQPNRNQQILWRNA
ncbi:uncharacterized protein LOC132059938 [Lycium ferocissimum]|uniref:uncharacterized protein LOC132059938 n=1 Tax=Lycium ferocissimum TaxID=112874 RepID=UPI00281505B6|nr:uncharacterized protein LOC132059938 [Lycium ferocissimum]